MDLKANHGTPVLGDAVPATKPRLSALPQGLSLVPYAAPGNVFTAGMYLTVPRKNVLVNGWLDSMMCSSPPRRKLGKGHPSDVAMEEATESLYKAWTLKYPSAISSFELIASSAKGKRVALFLDYDGTLSPIVDDPECAFMSNAMRSVVRRVAKYFPTAIISGRSRDKVFNFVGLTELHYAGSHGMDIMGPVRRSESVGDHPNCVRSTDKQGKEVHLFQPASKFVPMIDEVFRSLVKSTNGIKGAKVENNKFCASVHYRLVEEKSWPVVAQIVHDILKGYPELRLTHGRKVLEVRPVIDWNKGKAVEFLLESLGLNDSDDVLPIYIGDDRTDEDAFKVLKEQNLGYGILVSSVPKESSAFYSLKDPSEVLDFLKLLAKWKKLSIDE